MLYVRLVWSIVCDRVSVQKQVTFRNSRKIKAQSWTKRANTMDALHGRVCPQNGYVTTGFNIENRIADWQRVHYIFRLQSCSRVPGIPNLSRLRFSGQFRDVFLLKFLMFLLTVTESTFGMIQLHQPRCVCPLYMTLGILPDFILFRFCYVLEKQQHHFLRVWNRPLSQPQRLP